MFYYLSLAAALFAIGLYGLFARRHLLGKLISVFAMINAVVINLAAFSKFTKGESSAGIVFLLFFLLIILTQILIGASFLSKARLQNPENKDDGLDLLK